MSYRKIAEVLFDEGFSNEYGDTNKVDGRRKGTSQKITRKNCSGPKRMDRRTEKNREKLLLPIG